MTVAVLLKNNCDTLHFPLPTDSIGGDAYSQLLPDVVGVVRPTFCAVVAGGSFGAGSCV